MYVLLSSVSIRANFKPDFISFPVHRIPLLRLSQWLTILSQQSHLCPEQLAFFHRGAGGAPLRQFAPLKTCAPP